jgi:hypothetical protein
MKLDFEKAYDKIEWPFLQKIMCMKYFDPKWYSCIDHFASQRRVVIKVNNYIYYYFKTIKGLRQGDPLPVAFWLIGANAPIIQNNLKTILKM